MDHSEINRLKTELAEAVGLLRYAMESSSFREILTLERDIAAFLARHAQAEQQEAQSPMAKIAEGLRQKAADEWANHPSNPANQEAQGAQAVDERAAFEGKTVADRLDQMADAQPSGSSAQSDLYAAATVWRKHLAPPAAAHGDEAVRRDAERYRWLCNGHGYFMEESGLCGHSNEKDEADEAIDAAMRAQGDGETKA